MNRFQIRSPMIIHETLDGEVVVVNLEAGSYYSMAGTGARIWAGVERAATPDEIIEDIRASYADTDDHLDDTVHRFLGKLEEEGLIVPSKDGQPLPEVVDVTAPGGGEIFTTPLLERFTDMQELILLDPVHEVEEERGWPHANPTR